jgi:hypothetical protein
MFMKLDHRMEEANYPSFLYVQLNVYVAVMLSLSIPHLLTMHSMEDKLQIPIRDKA